MRILLALFTLTVISISASPPVLAETICRCECFPVPGGRVCRRHCYETEPFAFAQPEDDAAEPEVEEEEPQQHYEYATEDETPDDAPDLQVEPVSGRALRPPRREYAAPYEPSRSSFAHPPDPQTQALICRVFFGGLGLLVIIALWSLLSHFQSLAKARRDIKAVERHTKSANEIKRKLNDAAREADAFIENYRTDEYRRGRDF